MNPLNYGSLEACKRLVDNGIVLETEEVWYQGENGTWYLSDVPLPTHSIPAPSMAEVWRELPWYKVRDGEYRQLQMEKYENETCVHYDGTGPSFVSANPVDALIDLLIYINRRQ